MKSTDRVKAAKALLVDLLRFEVTVKDEDETGEGDFIKAPVFSEGVAYNVLGKDNARSVRGRLRRLCEVLGIRDMDLVASGREEVEVPTENRMRLWRVSDGLKQANSALQTLQFAVDDLDRSREFGDRVDYAREEVEQAAASAHVGYSKPEQALKRILRALGFNPETGRLNPFWKPKAKAKKKKKTKKKKTEVRK
jgi:hypothetical protein